MNQPLSNFLKFRSGRKTYYQPCPSSKAAAHLSVYFLHLRAVLDNERCAALILDAESGSILSSNLPAFELLAIDAVGFRLIELMADPTAYGSIVQQLQQTGKVHQRITLHNADGKLIDCKAKVTLAPYYSGWTIVRFNANRQLPCPPHSGH